MILQLLLNFVLAVLNAIFSWLPPVIELPFGVDSILVTAVRYFHGAMTTVPYLQVVWTCFLWALAFELLMLVLKIILGSRVPANNVN